MKRSVLFAVVSRALHVEWDMTMAVHTAAHALAENGWSSALVCVRAPADLCAARNVVFAAFAASDHTDMLCIDDDVSWPNGAVERLMSHHVDLVFGAYPLKGDGAGYALRGLPNRPDTVKCIDPVTGEEAKGGLIEVDGGPAGFMRITKKCADQMLKAYGDLWYEEKNAPTGKAWSLFEFMYSREEHRRWSEDIEFCRKYRAAGGKVWVDPWLMLEHTGKKTWRGCIGTDGVKPKQI